MATEANSLVQTLIAYCRQMPGMQEALDYDEREPAFNVLGGFLDDFAHFYLDETPPVVMLRCADPERERLAKESSGINVSDRMHWDTEGWAWTDIALDGTISRETLLSLIDQSYQLVCDSDAVNDDKRHEIDLIVRQLPQNEILDDLISWYGLSHRKKEIEQVARQAALLKTHAIDESEIRLGETRIGGLPDLPAAAQWPTHHSGRSLAFLAQINLSEVQKAVQLRELPESGILYIFSVYGWQVEDDADPQLPDDESEATWTQIIFEPNPNAILKQREHPSDVNGFKAARVEIVPAISLPDANEPIMQVLNWTEDEIETYGWKLACSFKTVRDNGLGHPANHLLLGYADYEQECVDIVAKHNLQLLFQLASDNNTWMCWGDGGFIYFWIKPEDLQRRDFSNMFVDYQCG